MVIPIKIVEKMEKVNELMTEIDKWIYDNLDAIDGSKHDIHQDAFCDFNHQDYYEFADKPTVKNSLVVNIVNNIRWTL